MSDTEVKNLPGIKERKLKSYGPCSICGKPLLDQDKGSHTFYVVQISHAVIDSIAIRRRVGLGLMLNDKLAEVMGPDEDLAKIVNGPKTGIIHEGCAGDVAHIGLIFGHD